MRRNASFWIAVALVVCGRAAAAATFLDTGFGTPAGGATSRSLAMGSTGVALLQGSDALTFNPATLALGDARLHADANLGLTQANEDRLVPIFDSFQSFTDETIIAINRNTYASGQGGVVWRLPAGMPMALGAGVFDRFDFDFDYFEEFRQPDGQAPLPERDRILQNRTFEVEGRLRSISGGYGAEIFRGARLGFSLHRYFGTVNGLRRVETPSPTVADTIATLQQELSGWGWSAGGHYRVNERVDLAASYDGAFDVDGARTSEVVVATSSGATATPSSATRKVAYPGTLRFGVAYHPRNVLRTVFAADAAHRFWEGTDETSSVLGQTVRLRDTWDLGLGVEHVFYNGLPLRFGFRYVENYADGESERSIFSVGTGYDIAGTNLAVTGLFHRQTSRQGFLFDPTFTSGTVVFPAPNSDAKVEDSIVQLVLGASRRF